MCRLKIRHFWIYGVEIKTQNKDESLLASQASTWKMTYLQLLSLNVLSVLFHFNLYIILLYIITYHPVVLKS